MPLSTQKLLDLLEQRRIMSPDHVDDLREQVAAAGVEIHAIFVARKLVEVGYLNPYYAKTLLEECREKPTPGRADEDELDLAPLEEELDRKGGPLEHANPSEPPVELRIELPPLKDPDDWPLPPSEKISSLPVAKTGGLRLFAQDTPARAARRRKELLVPWAIAGAALLLSLFLLLCLALR